MDPNLHTRDWIGRTLTIEVDRPLGTSHPKHPDIRYPLNYGYVPGVRAPDGEDLDAYILGPEAPLVLGEGYRALVVAIVRRRDDIEDKLVTVAEGHDPAAWDVEAIRRAVAFQEQFYDSWVEMPASTAMTVPDRLPALQRDADRLGLPLSEAHLATFEAYLGLIVEWNERAGLTSVGDLEEMQHRHFGESLALLVALREAGILPAPGTEGQPTRVADLGPGGGFPGVPMRIVEPALDLVLVESNQRRAEFLSHLAASLGLDRVEVVPARAEDAGRDPALREGFDLVVARALAPLAVLVEYGVPLLRRGGVLAAPKGSRAAEELGEAAAAITTLGAVALEPVALSLPEGAPTQSVLLVRREGDLDARYPRRAGMPTKRPLG